jgi:hypothetical protein
MSEEEIKKQEELQELEELEEELELYDDVEDCTEDCKQCIYAMTCTYSRYHPTREDWQWQEWAKWEYEEAKGDQNGNQETDK